MTSPMRMATAIRNAYEWRDRDALDQALASLQRWTVVAPTTPVRHLDPPALERRRAEVAAELNAIDAEMTRRRSEGHSEQLQARANWERSLSTFPAVVDPGT